MDSSLLSMNLQQCLSNCYMLHCFANCDVATGQQEGPGSQSSARRYLLRRSHAIFIDDYSQLGQLPGRLEGKLRGNSGETQGKLRENPGETQGKTRWVMTPGCGMSCTVPFSLHRSCSTVSGFAPETTEARVGFKRMFVCIKITWSIKASA
jgi:hypothetical protein